MVLQTKPTRGKLSGSLVSRRHALAGAAAQRQVLERIGLPQRFEEATASAGHAPLRASSIDVLQVNVGKYCNQTCRHCHVDAGPDRKEVMADEVVDACLAVLERTEIPILDITGGAPELHPRFREMVERGYRLGRQVIDRANLTALLLPAQAELPELLAACKVEIVASLPYYLAKQADAQRGRGVFDRSIEALRRLNALGYGVAGSGLTLNLMVNPVGAFLPGNQATLERDWKRELERRQGITFNSLYTITNMPIGRFLEFLEDRGSLEDYVHMLARSFNPAVVPNLMCRSTLSVEWNGRLHDCDFNQMLEIGLDAAAPQTIQEFDWERVVERRIVVGPHCYGCTAGAGASCGGSLT